MKEDKLYMKWWFWVVLGIVFIYLVAALMPYPDDCKDVEIELDVCYEDLDWWVDWFDEYEEIMQEYCELDSTNPLCDAWE